MLFLFIAINFLYLYANIIIIIFIFILTFSATYNVIFAPQVGNKGNITKQFLQETNTKINCNILNQHKNLSKMKDLTKSVIE